MHKHMIANDVVDTIAYIIMSSSRLHYSVFITAEMLLFTVGAKICS